MMMKKNGDICDNNVIDDWGHLPILELTNGSLSLFVPENTTSPSSLVFPFKSSQCNAKDDDVESHKSSSFS